MANRGTIKRSSCLLFLTFWIASVGFSSAGQGRYYDEFLWSKSNWPEYTLKFPFRGFLLGKKSGGSESASFSEYIRGYRQSLGNGRYESSMMDGGYDNVVEYLVRDGSYNVRGDGVQLHAGDVIQIRTHSFGQQQQQDGSLVSKFLHGGVLISDLLECDIQDSLHEILWPVVANYTLSHGVPLKEADLVNLGEEACAVEVPVDILRDRMLLQVIVVRAGDSAQSRASGTFGDLLDSVNDPSVLDRTVDIMKYSHDTDWINELSQVLDMKPSALEQVLGKRKSLSGHQILGPANQDQEHYFVLANRDSQHASPLEISAVTSACSDVLSNKDWRKSILDSQKVYLATALSVVDYSGSDENNAKSSSPKLDRSCVNFHPQCTYWAKKGECVANPKYMVGTRKTGQCRLACGVCEKKDLEALPPYLSAKNAQFLEDIYLETSSSLASRVCLKSGNGPISNAKENLSGILRQHSSSHANIADQMIEARGPITLRTFTPESVDEIKALDSTTVTRISTHQGAVVRLPETMAHYPDAVQRDDLDDSPRSLLWQALQDKCIYKHTGYWTYQVCHGISVEQYHTEDPSILTSEWSIQLGYFAPAESSYNILEIEASLYDKHHIPAILHVYEGGSECTVDEKEYDEEFDKGRPEQRRSLVYFMCSPDADSHMKIEETSRCVYRIEVYLPELCNSESLMVKARDEDGDEDKEVVDAGMDDEEKDEEEDIEDQNMVEEVEHVDT